MIISRTPYRVSLFGGGTDYPDWYLRNNGAVISFSINRYSYITCRYLPQFFDFKYRIRYFKREEVNEISEIQHPSIRECIRMSSIIHGLDIIHHGDLPAMSGLGTSSSFTVGMIHALEALKGAATKKQDLAIKAIEIEQKILKENVGSQDQVAAAFGGLNRINFHTDGKFSVNKLIISRERVKQIEDSICMFYTGIIRIANTITGSQIENIRNGLDLSNVMEVVDEFEELVGESGNFVENFGKLLERQWEIKKNYADNISNNFIDQIYLKAKNNGAIGGKLLGAGSGGFILFVTEDKKRLINALNEVLHVPIEIDTEGSKIIHYE